MSFLFKCPECQIELEAEEDWIGQIAECPSCGKEITISSATETFDNKEVKPARKRKSVKKTPTTTEDKGKKTTAGSKTKPKKNTSGTTAKSTKKRTPGKKVRQIPEPAKKSAWDKFCTVWYCVIGVVGIFIFIVSTCKSGCSCKYQSKHAQKVRAEREAHEYFEGELIQRAINEVSFYDRDYYKINPYRNAVGTITDSSSKYITIEVKTEGVMNLYYKVIFEKQIDGYWKAVTVSRK